MYAYYWFRKIHSVNNYNNNNNNFYEQQTFKKFSE